MPTMEVEDMKPVPLGFLGDPDWMDAICTGVPLGCFGMATAAVVSGEKGV